MDSPFEVVFSSGGAPPSAGACFWRTLICKALPRRPTFCDSSRLSYAPTEFAARQAGGSGPPAACRCPSPSADGPRGPDRRPPAPHSLTAPAPPLIRNRHAEFPLSTTHSCKCHSFRLPARNGSAFHAIRTIVGRMLYLLVGTSSIPNQLLQFLPNDGAEAQQSPQSEPHRGVTMSIPIPN
jgi:hypothetical protein